MPPALRLLRLAISFIVAILVITATEITIVWNNLSNVNDLSSAGQLIPLLIGAFILLRVIYVRVFYNQLAISRRLYIRPPWSTPASELILGSGTSETDSSND
jgi:hypothetical protein